ncbi:MAG: glycerol kinase GlpK [Nannocystaceae bacterium]
MSDQGYILAIDQGTTGSTALLINAELQVVAKANEEFRQIYPQPGWVEHDAADIWASVEVAVTGALGQANVRPEQIRTIGITNQRETSLLWDRESAEPIHNAIVWQCRRTSERCAELRAAGHEELVRERTGLVLDPYFSGTKAAWTLDHVPGARERADAGQLAFGTIDTYLVWRLTDGAHHVTDVTNASRTMIMDIHRGAWDEDLAGILNLPMAILPKIVSSSEVYGETRGVGFLPDGIPVSGIAGDQQAALFGQACFEPGQAKSTYGTGAFVLMNTGESAPRSENGLLTTIAWKIGDGPTTYALEGSVFIAGAAVQWLRDELKIIDAAPEVEALARSVEDAGGVWVIPAFAGLGAPYWDADARGAILGLTRGSNRGHVARATLEGIAHQVADVVEAMSADSGRSLEGLRVDGGAAANGLLMQLQADLLGTQVARSAILETTALGAALLAGLAVGFWSSTQEITERWAADRSFAAELGSPDREIQRKSWRDMVNRVRGR